MEKPVAFEAAAVKPGVEEVGGRRIAPVSFARVLELVLALVLVPWVLAIPVVAVVGFTADSGEPEPPIVGVVGVVVAVAVAVIGAAIEGTAGR